MQAEPPLELPTPSALVDEARLAANIARMQSRMNDLGVHFRPHVKTGKCLEIARRQMAAGAKGITVSTLKEAEQFFAAGFDDILYAVGIAPNKIEAALGLQKRGCRLQLLVDSVTAAHLLTEAAQRHALVPKVLIEIDVDGHRSGVPPESPLLLEIGRALVDGGAELHGVMTHAGASYECSTQTQLEQAAEQERARCVRAAERLRVAGLPCPVVSVGSTPTALSATQLRGVTEVRAGVYVFFDLVMAGIGVCRINEIALSVLCTVIGHQREKGWAIVDAGWMAMSRDRGTQKQAIDQGYGLVCDQDGNALPGLFFGDANQEHGIIAHETGEAGADIAARLPLGTRLRILPNHACATGAQHEAYYLMRGQTMVAQWPRFSGW